MDQAKMTALLRELTETPGISGDEGRVRELIREKVEEHADSVEVDSLGNLIARKGSGERTLMVAAHMDQIGLVVKRVDDNGFIHVGKVWGTYPKVLVNQRVIVEASDGEERTGVIGVKPIHMQEDEEQKELPEMKKLFVDVGAEDEDDVRDMGVRVGDYIRYDQGFAELENGYVTAPAFDDRAGCAALIDAFNRFDGDFELVAVFSAQEEVGTKGATTSAFRVDPDVGLAVDVTIAGDVPNIEVEESAIKTGEGVGIELLQTWGRGAIPPSTVREWLLETAESGDHDHFRDLGSGNDARAIEMVRQGVPTGSISIPARYIHSPVEVIKVSDIQAAADLLSSCFGTFEDYF